MAELETMQSELEAPEVLNGDAGENEEKEDEEPSESGKKKRRKKKKNKTAAPGKTHDIVDKCRFENSQLLRAHICAIA